MRHVLSCEGSLTVQPDGSASCVGEWVAHPVHAPFDVTMLDPQSLGAFFGVGFTLVGSFCLLGVVLRRVAAALT